MTSTSPRPTGWFPLLAAVLLAGACGGPLDEDAGEDEGLEVVQSEAEAALRTNVNTATVVELQRVAGMTQPIATGLVAGRPWFTLSATRAVRGVTATLYSRFQRSLTVGAACGGTRGTACAAGLRCARKTSASRSTGVCLSAPPLPPPPAATVTLVPAATYSAYAHDPTSPRANRVLYGYTTLTAGDFAGTTDKGTIGWYRSDHQPGHEVALLHYVTPTPAGYYTQVNAAADVPAQGTGIVFRVIFTCADSQGGHDCGESDVAYRAVNAASVGWAGNWGLRSYYPGTGRGTALPDDQPLSATGHYPSSLTIEFWTPGLTSAPVADVGAKVEIETDLQFDYSPTPPGPGTMHTYAMNLEGDAGNNWRASIMLPVNFGRAQWNQTFRYRVRISLDGGRQWVQAGRGTGLSDADSWRTLRIGTACADGTTGC